MAESIFVPPLADPDVRVERFVRGGDVAAVARLLRGRRDEILRRWLSAAGLQPFLRGVPERAAADHIPELFDALVALLERHAGPDSPDADRATGAEAPLDDPAVQAAAEAHARERLDQGFRPTDVVTEFRLLRQEIGRALRLALADQAHRDVDTDPADVVAAELLIHDALDGAIGLALAALTAYIDVAVERHRATLAQRQRAEDALRVLAEAGRELTGSLDYERTLENVARVAVPRFADWCVIRVVEGDGSGAEDDRRYTVRVAAANPEKEALLRELSERFPPDSGSRSPAVEVLRTGTPILVEQVGDEWPDAVERGPEHRRIVERLAPRSFLIVPLQARGRTLGTVTIAYSESGRRYDAGDLPRAQELADRAALAIDNARLYRESQDALRTRDAVLAAVSHDLRAPLAAVSGQAQLIERQAARGGAPEDERLARRAAMIVSSVRRMTAMVDELLDVARLRAGERLELLLAPADLVALARRVAAEQQRQTDAHLITVHAETPELVGQWDAGRIERALTNLIGNALKYSPHGGDVDVTLRREGDAAVIEVRDQGIGISPSDAARIFEPFQRGGALAAKVSGQGIGLASARHIVQAHGGSIGVESAPGEGSTFTVRLPLSAPQP